MELLTTTEMSENGIYLEEELRLYVKRAGLKELFKGQNLVSAFRCQKTRRSKTC